MGYFSTWMYVCVSTNICLYVCFIVMEFFFYNILYIFAFLIKISKSIHSTIDTTTTREKRNARKKEWIKHNLTFVWVASFWDGGNVKTILFDFISSFRFLFFFPSTKSIFTISMPFFSFRLRAVFKVWRQSKLSKWNKKTCREFCWMHSYRSVNSGWSESY